MAAKIATLSGANAGFGKSIVGGALHMLAASGHANPVAALRQMSPLPRDAQEMMDNSIIRVGRENLVIFNDLYDAGLVFPLPNWLSVTTITAQRAGETGRAQVGLVPNTRGERQVAPIEEYSTPVFCVWDDWEFDAKTLATAARANYPLDATSAEQATRNVNEKLEQITLYGVLDGADGKSGSQQKFYSLPVYGLLNAPNASTYTYTGSVAWDAGAKTGTEILADIVNMLKTAEAGNIRGPWTLYISRAYAFKMMLEFVAGYPQTILQRVQQIPGLTIVVADTLEDDQTILIKKSTSTFDFLVGMLPTSFSWPTNPQMPFSGTSAMVAACIVPRPKYDYNDQTGILLGNVT